MFQAHISRVLGCVLPRESLQSGPLLNTPLCQRFLDSQVPRSLGQGVKSGFFVIFRRLYRLGIDDNVWPGDNGFTLGLCVVKCISQWTAINYKRTACINGTLRRNLAQFRHKVLATKLNETRKKSFQTLTKGLTNITKTIKKTWANERRVKQIITREFEKRIQFFIIVSELIISNTQLMLLLLFNLVPRVPPPPNGDQVSFCCCCNMKVGCCCCCNAFRLCLLNCRFNFARVSPDGGASV